MIIKIDNYNLGRKIASLAFTSEVYEDLKKNNLETILLEEHNIYFRKSNVRIDITPKVHEQFRYCDNYDVFQIDEKGNAYLYYNNEADDNAFMITGKCNSNCIMCPASNYQRKNGSPADMDELLKIIHHIPADPRHFTITGGEPFLAGDKLFVFLRALKYKFKYTDFLLLTNGRALSIPSFCAEYHKSAPYNLVTGIPVHGYNSVIHDMITQTPGSFEQTLSGIDNLLKAGRKVEIRIVVSLQNYKHIGNIAELIIRKLPNVDSVKIMGMEMTGSAAVNRKKLWLDYASAFEASKEGIDRLIHNGIDVALYNFPLCSVNMNYRMLCRKSITDYKVRFSKVCDTCRIKDACGGIFTGSFLLAANDVKPEESDD